ncbi:hypothetical protein PVAP13_5KG588100 [Panicum virgatum]|uniref:Uncharacterized protein n=1 Tax=Panicum virgatum TaxID=38727 RepID=A0A8T0SPB8_PANVG|nr:hypothetical protein PVAP13_5KG588100 [Panicum virgatum]
MAPAALAASVASVSPAAAAFAPGGGVRLARIASLAPLRSTRRVLPPTDLLGSARQRRRLVAWSSTSSPSETSTGDSQSPKQEKAPFGYTRKDVLLIGAGVTAFGVGLKYGLELVGVDPLQAGNVVQLLVVLGMTVGWISTYMFRVANKDMTYAQQLRDYEKNGWRACRRLSCRLCWSKWRKRSSACRRSRKSPTPSPSRRNEEHAILRAKRSTGHRSCSTCL